MKIGDSVIFLNDAMGATLPTLEPGRTAPLYLHLYVPDVDAVFASAIGAGAKVEMPVQDMFWGDRYGKLTDPFGHQWGLATHKEDVSPEELAKRQAAFFAKSACMKVGICHCSHARATSSRLHWATIATHKLSSQT